MKYVQRPRLPEKRKLNRREMPTRTSQRGSGPAVAVAVAVSVKTKPTAPFRGAAFVGITQRSGAPRAREP